MLMYFYSFYFLKKPNKQPNDPHSKGLLRNTWCLVSREGFSWYYLPIFFLKKG